MQSLVSDRAVRKSPNDWNYEHRADVQGLRAIAVTSVVCFHAGLPVPGGFSGVDIFFVISGFVITLLLSRQFEREGSIHLPAFYLRRFKRLMPALALVVFVTIGLGIFFLSPVGMQGRVSAYTGLGAILLSANAIIAKFTGGYFNLAASENPLLNLWSLSVEEQFYLLFPTILSLVFILTKRRKDSRYASLILIALLTGVSLAAALLGSSAIIMPGKVRLLLGFYSPVSRAWEFGIGALLALLRHVPINRMVVEGLATIGLIGLIASFWLISGADPYPSVITLLPVLGTGALILAGTSRGHISPVSRLLATRPFGYIGDISYSWYLWHWPMIAFAAKMLPSSSYLLPLVGALSIFPAIGSYHWIENPLRRHALRSRQAAVRLFAYVLIPPLAICSLSIFVLSHGYWSHRIQVYQATIGPMHIAERSGCGVGLVPSPSDTVCLWNAGATGNPIYLIGDSNAGHLSEAIIAAGTKLGSPVRIITFGGCSLVGRSWSNQSDAAQAECQKFADRVLDFIRHSKPGIVVLGLSDSNWWIDGLRVGPSRREEMADPQKIFQYLSGSLVKTVRLIQQVGHTVLLVQPVPKYITKDNKYLYDPDECTLFKILAGTCPRKAGASIAFENNRQGEARASIANASTATGSPLLDLRTQFCSQGRCRAIDRDGVLLYRDAGHLSVAGTQKLTGVFYRELFELRR